MILDRPEGATVLFLRASLTELEPCKEALEADESGNVAPAVLTYGIHGRWDMVDQMRSSFLRLHVIHDGDIGDVGVC